MFKVFRRKIAIAGAALTLGGCAHFVPSTRVTPPIQPAQQGVAAARAQAVQMQIFLDVDQNISDGRDAGEYSVSARRLTSPPGVAGGVASIHYTISP